MTKLRFLGREIFFVVGIGWRANWHLLDHFQSVTFQANDFLWVVGQKPELAHAEVEKDLRTKSVVAQIGWEPEFRVGLNGVEALFLQFVGVNFRSETDAAAFLSHVNKHAVAFLGNLPQRRVQLISAVASARTEHVASKTFAVNTDQRRLVLVDLSLY